MKIKSKKLTIIVGVLAVVVFVTFFQNNRSINLGQDKSLVKTECQHYGFLEEDDFFPKYIVKRGDTLLSISNNFLGSTDRVQELIMLNIRKHSSLSLKKPFIEVGWELLIPPKFIESSSGSLFIHAGEIKSQNNDIVIVNIDSGIKSTGDQLASYIQPNSKYLGKDSFEVGDCVFVLADSGKRHNHLVAISPQDKNYFKD